MRHLGDFHGHAERFGNRFQRDSLIAHLNALQCILIGVRALIGRNARTQIADIHLDMLCKRFFDDGDLIECANFLRMIEKPEKRLFLFIPAVRIKIIRKPAGLRIRGFPLPDGFMYFGQTVHVLFQHLFLRARLSDLDLHEKVAVIHRIPDLADRYGIGHQRNACNRVMMTGQSGSKCLRDQVIEIFDLVGFSKEHPGCVIKAHERIQGKGFSESGCVRDLLAVPVYLIQY